MLCLGWAFLWFVAGEWTTGFDHSACATKKLLWTYSVRGEEDFVLFCNLSELQKSHLSHKSQLSPTEDPAHRPCSGSQNLSDVQWYMQPWSGGPLKEINGSSPHKERGMLHILTSQMNNGSYICRPRIRSPQDTACCLKIFLEVKLQTNVSCKNSVQHKQYLLLGSVGSISCPSLSCQSDVQSPKMTWYKDGTLKPNSMGNPLEVNEAYDFDQGLYVCDYTQSDNVSSWTVRAVVQVRTIVKDTNKEPNILDPFTDTLEVELGKPLTLPCKVQFGFERKFKPVIKWYIKEATQEWEIPNSEPKRIQSSEPDTVMEHTIFLGEVTQADLSRKFVCFAQNSNGNTTRTIRLKKKEGVVLAYILLGTAVVLVGMLVAAALLYWYWIEVILLCRTYRSKDEILMGSSLACPITNEPNIVINRSTRDHHNSLIKFYNVASQIKEEDWKEFDAFVSYANWSSPESEATGSLSEEHLALSLFPEVLENKYGYTLCLLERDVAPGGVYADDIVSIIKKSRRGIFILSPSYVNGPCVFELQAAVNLALVDQTLKLILIKFCSFQEPETLPYLVKKALRVLPTVTWRGLKSAQPSSRFWTQICYHMPVKNSNSFMWNWLRLIRRVFTSKKDLVRQKSLGGVASSGNSCHGALNLPLQPPEEMLTGRTCCVDQTNQKLSLPSLSTKQA